MALRVGRCEQWCNVHGMRRQVVEKNPDQTGFVVLVLRWVVGRISGWLSHRGGLLRGAPFVSMSRPAASPAPPASWPPTLSTIQSRFSPSNRL